LFIVYAPWNSKRNPQRKSANSIMLIQFRNTSHGNIIDTITCNPWWNVTTPIYPRPGLPVKSPISRLLPQPQSRPKLPLWRQANAERATDVRIREVLRSMGRRLPNDG
ncbi:15205_t:CDS:2, partial [Acaulospora morrowiae]